jgi:hypothetical protein
VTTSPEYGGNGCPNLHSERNCLLKYCPVDCDYNWGPWSECSLTCGGGYTTREPTVYNAHAYGGKECPAAERQVCNTDYCAVDCYMGEWGEWSSW